MYMKGRRGERRGYGERSERVGAKKSTVKVSEERVEETASVASERSEKRGGETASVSSEEGD